MKIKFKNLLQIQQQVKLLAGIQPETGITWMQAI